MGASLLALAKSIYYSQYYGPRVVPKSSANKVIIIITTRILTSDKQVKKKMKPLMST